MALQSSIGSRLPFTSFPSTCRSRSPSLALSARPASRLLRIKPLRSARLDPIVTREAADDEMGEGFFETIEELERMARDPSDVLGGMAERLSPRELQLVLVYFAQEGRDCYCALEVFDWLRRENRVDGETMELMVSIACGWIQRLIGGDHEVGEVVALLNEMDCVGIRAGFSMVEKVVSLYWETGKKEEAVVFVKDVMRRGGVGGYRIADGSDDGRGGPVGYLAWKMIVDGNYQGAAKMVIEFKGSGLKPELYSFLIAMTALVKEQKEFSKALRKLKGSIKAETIDELNEENTEHVKQYQSDLIRDGIQLSNWALEEGGSAVSVAVHEKLLAMYICAGYGLEAENELWQLKLLGKEIDRELYNVVLAICASQNEVGAVRRLLTATGVEAVSLGPRKKTLSWLLRGYVKGGYYVDASETVIKMLDLGICPEYLDRVAVLQGLRKSILETGDIQPYITLCKRLSDADLVGPCLVYLYISRYKMWIIKTL